MKISERFNAFYEEQPPLKFIDELKSPIHQKKPEWFGNRALNDGEVSADGAYLDISFSDAEGVLEAAFDDFNLFLNVYKMRGNKFPIYIRKEKTSCFEEFFIHIGANSCTLGAGDTEGIRRALIYLEDELCRHDGPVLTKGTIHKKPNVKSRITRGFFSPTNRPPKNIDELYNDINYYPDEYLNRLAHDGTNGLWIYTRLSDLVRTKAFPEFGEGREKRIAKIRKIIDRCKRYGVKVYLFIIDPYALTEELKEKYPELAGVKDWDGYTFCTYCERGENHCIEAMQQLFEVLPDLGGCIDITNGERTTSCASNDNFTQCPRYMGKSKAEILAHTTDLLREGMRRAKTDAEFISWTYGHRHWDLKDVDEYVRKAPKDVIIMQDFEDNGISCQLGKPRIAVDYWLSYAGPSELYEVSSAAAKETGKQMYAKMQVCCSHELATSPYIPVPGILFDKYSANVSGVMQCWYFGNYPSLMSKAAGLLSFTEDFSDKEKFLKQLCGIYFKNSDTENAIKAWQYFEEGYKNYPVNILFSYYGPAHDGVVWNLQLKPKNRPLSRSWQYCEPADGDRIGDCLFANHSIEETSVLLERITENWQKGLSLLPKSTPDEQRSVSDALGILFKSAKNIINFYKLRCALSENPKNSADILSKMRSIVLSEMQNSNEMYDICIKDSRLGYHSEAENFKFFPAQLKKRVGMLQNLLDTEFKEVEGRIKNGLFPLEYYLGDRDGYKMAHTLSDAKTEIIPDTDARFRLAYDKENIYLEFDGTKDSTFIVQFEYTPMFPACDIRFRSGKKFLLPFSCIAQGYFGDKISEEENKYACVFKSVEDRDIYTLTIKRSDVGWTEDKPMKLRIENDDISWKKSDDPTNFLHICSSPENFGWLMP